LRRKEEDLDARQKQPEGLTLLKSTDLKIAYRTVRGWPRPIVARFLSGD